MFHKKLFLRISQQLQETPVLESLFNKIEFVKFNKAETLFKRVSNTSAFL